MIFLIFIAFIPFHLLFFMFIISFWLFLLYLLCSFISFHLKNHYFPTIFGRNIKKRNQNKTRQKLCFYDITWCICTTFAFTVFLQILCKSFFFMYCFHFHCFMASISEIVIQERKTEKEQEVSLRWLTILTNI